MMNILYGILIGFIVLSTIKLIPHLIRKVLFKKHRTKIKLKKNVEKDYSAEAKVLNAEASKNKLEVELIIANAKASVINDFENKRKVCRERKLIGKKTSLKNKFLLKKHAEKKAIKKEIKTLTNLYNKNQE